MARRFEILEHTADVGLRAWGATLEELFASATEAVAYIAGAWEPGTGEEISIEVEAADREGLLVAWLSETLYLFDSRGGGLGGVGVASISRGSCRGWVTLRELQDPDEGVQVKAVTYHQLEVTEGSDGWMATVYLDI
ncbi:MAG TPA: archease [Actinomycetota bacterium]|nr:archease [Actinomycetota bacterium]